MSATTTAIELERLPHTEAEATFPATPTGSPPSSPRESSPSGGYPEDREVTPLASADSGSAAWLFLLGATLIETTVWGLLNAVGILQHYWTTERFRGHEATVTLAAALMNGLCFMSTGVFGP